MEYHSTVNLDQTDLSILRILQQNSRLTVKEVAAQVHLSTTPVFERIKRLERDGYIKKYITVLDAEKLNKGFIVYCSVKISPLNKETAIRFGQTIQEIPEVTECYNISGKFDYLLKIHAPDMKYYQQFLLEVIGTLPYIGAIESTFVMEEIKHHFGVVV